MIKEAEFQSLCGRFPALGGLPSKVAWLAREELDPGEQVELAEAVGVGKVGGCALLTERRLLVLWQTKMFVFFKFPTIQEFNLSQMTRVEPNGATLSLRAEADPSDPDAGWEENALTFNAAETCAAFAARLSAAA